MKLLGTNEETVWLDLLNAPVTLGLKTPLTLLTFLQWETLGITSFQLSVFY